MSRLQRFLVIALAVLLTGCASVPELGGLMDRGGSDGRKIVVKLGVQKAYLYHHGKLVAVSPISSGREGKRTPVGKFRVVQKKRDHQSSL